jgi:hypothetical protein
MENKMIELIKETSDVAYEDLIKAYNFKKIYNQKNREQVKRWKKNHPESVKVSNKIAYDKLKEENPEKYELMLLKKKAYYRQKKMKKAATKEE